MGFSPGALLVLSQVEGPPLSYFREIFFAERAYYSRSPPTRHSERSVLTVFPRRQPGLPVAGRSGRGVEESLFDSHQR